MSRHMVYFIMLVTLAFVLTVPVSAQQPTSRLRFVHAAAEVPAVDVYLDGKAVLTGIDFATVSRDLELGTGRHQIAVAPAGQGQAAAVLVADLDLVQGPAYTVAAVNTPRGVTMQVLRDDVSQPEDDTARVRLIHLASNGPSAMLRRADGTVLIALLPRLSASNPVLLEPGAYDFLVRSGGAAIEFPATAVEAGKLYDVITVGPADALEAVLSVRDPVSSTTAQLTYAADRATPATLPDTSGKTANARVLVGIATLVIAGGLLVRRRAAQSTHSG